MSEKLIPIKTLSREEAVTISPLSLAFVGDAVQTLYVRARLVTSHDMKAGALHHLASEEISAEAQAQEIEKMLLSLTEEENWIYKRARNSKTGRKAKNATVVDYRKASGLEAVFGFLYLTGNEERLSYLLELASGVESGK